MNLLAYVFSGLIIGVVIGFIIKSYQTSNNISREDGFFTDQMKEKQENLQKIREFIKDKGKITNNDIEQNLKVSNATATRYLDELEKEGRIKQVGETGKYTYYNVVK